MSIKRKVLSGKDFSIQLVTFTGKGRVYKVCRNFSGVTLVETVDVVVWISHVFRTCYTKFLVFSVFEKYTEKNCKKTDRF